MAKAKSKKITLEEALVPVEKQPYEVPENWCWIKLGTISSIISKGTTPKGGKTAYVDEGIDFLRVENINDDGTICHDDMMHVTEETHTGFLKRSILEENDILVSIAGTLGKTAIVKNDDLPLNTNQAVAFVRLRDNGEISREYIRYAIDTPVIQNILMSKTKVTAIPNLTLEIISECLIPLPPLSEQQRIVEQIESLFTKLDEAKEKTLSVVESYELREKAIYKKAFEGDLTNSWRAENGINISEWEEIPFEKLGKLERGRSKHRPRNDKRLFGGKYPFIQTGDVAGAGMYVTSHKQTLSEFGFEQSRMFPKGTLCITIAANIGDAAILSYDCCFPDSVVGFTPGEKCLNKYMYFYLQEIKAELEYIAPATAQKNLNLKLLGKVEIKVPSLKEQEKIVEILEKQINDQENIVEKAENVIETIDVMKKSILAKAFRGELGTNIETEESAIELLKSIF